MLANTPGHKAPRRRHAKTLAPVLLLVGIAAAAHPAVAQQNDPAPGLTVEALIGDSVSNTDDERYRDVAEAIQRFKNRDQLSARTFLERALQKDPKLPPVGVLAAKMQLLSGNSAAIRPALEQAVQEDSAGDPEPFLLLAEDALQGGRTIEADALFDKAASVIEGYDANAKRKRQFVIRAYRGRAVVAERRKNWEQAESDLRKWLEEDPENTAAINSLGRVLFMRGDARGGYEQFVAAKRIDDKLPNPFVSAAIMYDQLDQRAEAMRAFQRAFESDADDPTTLVAYAQALLKARENSKAESVLERARNNAADNANVWLLSGVNARIMGDPAAAEQHLLRAMSLAPSNRDVMNQLAQLLVDSNSEDDRKRALAFAQLNAQVNQNNPDVNITLAWVLYQSGQNARATAAIRQALQGGAFSADGSYLLAKMFLARNDKENAKRLLESAVKREEGLFVDLEKAEALLATL